MNEFAALLYDKVNNLEQEGLKNTYAVEIQAIFQDVEIMEKSDLEVELNVLSLFFMLIEYLKDWIQKKRQNWVGIFREKTILCQLTPLASRPNLINKQRRPSRTILLLKKNTSELS
jgi:hypothetical protein